MEGRLYWMPPVHCQEYRYFQRCERDFAKFGQLLTPRIGETLSPAERVSTRIPSAPKNFIMRSILKNKKFCA
jgi:hypothetical protein